MKNSLIISTYNWPKALHLVMKSVKEQNVLPDEVIIADDGSSEDTRILIKLLLEDFPIPLIHVWQEDQGFRKATILNKAIAKASGQYIIQADGDCILHPAFVKDHLEFIQKDAYLFGSRVTIKQGYLKQLFETEQIKFSPFSKGIKKRTRAIHAPLLSLLYAKSRGFSKKFRGCNTSFYRSDFIAVNGYNEEFKGWGREDSELALRFHNFGLHARRLRYRGIVYHIYHHEKSKSRLEMNNEIEMNTKNKKVVWCENGIDQYLNEH